MFKIKKIILFNYVAYCNPSIAACVFWEVIFREFCWHFEWL